MLSEMPDDVPAGSAKNIRNKRGKAKARALQELLNSVFLGCDVTDDAKNCMTNRVPLPAL